MSSSLNAMDLEVAKNFGRGPRELGGAVDLISHYKLWPHHEFFCKKSLPLSISETKYLHNVVGETKIRNGEGMELDQLFQNTSHVGNTKAHIHPFELDVLREAFHMKETTPIDLPHGEKGDSKDTRRQKKKRNRDKDEDKDRKKHKHRHKDPIRAKDKDKMGNGFCEVGPDHFQKHQDKKRRNVGSEDNSGIQRYQQSGVTSAKQNSRINDKGKLRIAR